MHLSCIINGDSYYLRPQKNRQSCRLARVLNGQLVNEESDGKSGGGNVSGLCVPHY